MSTNNDEETYSMIFTALKHPALARKMTKQETV
jgi:hypothetical protein